MPTTAVAAHTPDRLSEQNPTGHSVPQTAVPIPNDMCVLRHRHFSFLRYAEEINDVDMIVRVHVCEDCNTCNISAPRECSPERTVVRVHVTEVHNVDNAPQLIRFKIYRMGMGGDFAHYFDICVLSTQTRVWVRLLEGGACTPSPKKLTFGGGNNKKLPLVACNSCHNPPALLTRSNTHHPRLLLYGVFIIGLVFFVPPPPKQRVTKTQGWWW